MYAKTRLLLKTWKVIACQAKPKGQVVELKLTIAAKICRNKILENKE